MQNRFAVNKKKNERKIGDEEILAIQEWVTEVVFMNKTYLPKMFALNSSLFAF